MTEAFQRQFLRYTYKAQLIILQYVNLGHVKNRTLPIKMNAISIPSCGRK